MAHHRNLLLSLAVAPLNLLAQGGALIPDMLSEGYGHQWTFVDNDGRCFDLGGNYRQDVIVQSVGTVPTISVMTGRRTTMCIPVYHEEDHSQDSVVRVDWTFVGENVNTTEVEKYDVVGATWNFYERYTPQGITGVKGCKRVVQQNIYDSIDYHLLSNQYGLKILIVVRPGGDPGEITFLFEGQDSLVVDSAGMLRLYNGQRFVRLKQGFAYQQQGSTVTYIPWAAHYENVHGSSLVTLELGAYDPTLPLILMITPWEPTAAGGGGGGGPLTAPEWCTYVNGAEKEGVTDMTKDAFGNVYFIGNSHSSIGLPIFAGVQQFVFGGLSDVIYGRFNSNYELETLGTWTTYLGGTALDYAPSITYDAAADRIWFCGNIQSSTFSNLPYAGNPSCYQRPHPAHGFVAFASAYDGQLNYFTHYQNGGFAEITGIDCDADGNAYVVGWGDPDGFDPVDLSGTGDYFYGGPYPYFGVNSEDGFIAKFSSNADHLWETALRGPDVEYIRGVLIDRVHDKIYVYGNSRTRNDPGVTDGSAGCEQYEFPLKNAGGWYQPVKNSTLTIPYYVFDGIIMRFDGATLGLDWSTYVGGTGGNECISDMAVDGLGNVYATGYTDSPYYSSTPCGWTSGNYGFPACHPGSEYFQPVFGGESDDILLKFDINTAMLWSTFIGGSKIEKEPSTDSYYPPALAYAAHPDNSITLFASSASGTDLLNTDPPITMVPSTNYYQQLWHADLGLATTETSDCYVAVFTSDGIPLTSTFFGGIGEDWPGGVVTSTGRTYIGGGTYSNLNFPLSCPPGWLPIDPYCNSVPLCNSTSTDAFLAQLQKAVVVGIEENEHRGATEFSLFPNPTSGTATLVHPQGMGEFRIILLDALGRIIEEVDPGRGSTTDLDLTDRPSGFYVVAIPGSSVRYLRLIKE